MEASTSACPVVSSVPELPARPVGMSAMGADYSASPYGASRYGTGMTSAYGSTYGNAYSSPYSRFGQSSMYGSGFGMGSMGMGGYGGGYGGNMYGQPVGGFGMGGIPGPNGMMVGPDGLSLSQRMESGTAATFQILESVVGAFGGFAQMLESTFMATHSSFFAMIGVAEQFGHLRNYLGQVLSIFALIRWVKSLIARITGQELPPDPSSAAGGLTADSFKQFQGGVPQTPPKPKLSKKPLFIFFLTVVGLPYLMNKLVRLITARQEEELRLRGGQPGFLPQQIGGPAEVLDPKNITFVSATHSFTPSDPSELALEVNDIVAVLSPPSERMSPGWWRGRKRDGKVGWFPTTHVAELPTQKKTIEPKVIDKSFPVGT